MKVRNYFVSNSSSSSFIITYDPKNITVPCPCCHRAGINIIDYFRNLNTSYSSDSTELTAESKEIILRRLNSELDESNAKLKEYNRHPSSKIVPTSWGGTATYADYIEQESATQTYLTDLISKINEVPDENETIEITISYHDETTHELLRNELHSGNIRIIYDQEDREF